jgi:4-oxalomesaconate tautomerase
MEAGPMMNLGDVSTASVPKMTLVSAPTNGGAISTRSFIPHRVHATIGVLAAITVATATRLAGSPAATLASPPAEGRYIIEHPTGIMEVFLDTDGEGNIKGAGTVRTARKLFDGVVFSR